MVPERLREEIMAHLVNRAAVGGSAARSAVSPATASWRSSARRAELEDRAFRACLAALGIQEEAKRLHRSESGVGLALQGGLELGPTVAGPFGYTAVAEQGGDGTGREMESAAPPGEVMLSTSTARLVDGTAALGEPELVQHQGVRQAGARLSGLLGMEERHRPVGRVGVESGRSTAGAVGRRRLVGPRRSTATAQSWVRWGLLATFTGESIGPDAGMGGWKPPHQAAPRMSGLCPAAGTASAYVT